MQQLDDLTDDQLMRKLADLTEKAKPLLARLPAVIDAAPVRTDVGALTNTEDKYCRELKAMNFQVLPPLSAEDYAALKSSIAARGVLVPVDYDEEGNILDGHHRGQICSELGITTWPKLIRKGSN